MIFVVTENQLSDKLPEGKFMQISYEQSCQILEKEVMLQFDTETSGLDQRLDSLLSMQFGTLSGKYQIVTIGISPLKYKHIFETKRLIMHNGKFDLQWLFNYNIMPTKIYDTMIVEQLLHLGYNQEKGLYGLKNLANKYLKIELSKEQRAKINAKTIYDIDTIEYAAHDVQYLYSIMKQQIQAGLHQECITAITIENNAVLATAYLEWCGIKLDKEKWKNKINNDLKHKKEAKQKLDKWFINWAKEHKFDGRYVYITHAGEEGFDYEEKKELIVKSSKNIPTYLLYKNKQLDLFNPSYNNEWQVNVNWDSPIHLGVIAKLLGFNTQVKDKKTGELKDSVLEKQLVPQHKINNEFIQLLFGYDTKEGHVWGYKEASKVCSTYGQTYIDCINPKTGRIHTVYRQLGAASGRMSCGTNINQESLSKANHVSKAILPNIQQLPHDEETRSCFISEPGNMFVSCDYSALESRLGADIYQEPAMLDEFLNGSGDMHSLCAKMVFAEELKDIPTKEVKKKRPDLRSKVKSVEFAKQFGGSSHAIAGSLGCSIEEANIFSNAYDKGFKGVTAFKEKGSKLVRKNGYVLMCAASGHKMYWQDHSKWLSEQLDWNKDPNFWKNYNDYHKGKNTPLCKDIQKHSQIASKWDRMALNAPTQGTGCVILKTAMYNLYRWIIKNNLFGKVKLCAAVHDELCVEYPETLTNFPQILENIMEKAASYYCKSLPIPAEASVGKYWIH